MQDATELKQFLESTRPMLLALGNTRDQQSEFLEKLTALSNPNHIIFQLKAHAHLQPPVLIKLLSKHWATREKIGNDKRFNKTFVDILDCFYAQEQTCLLYIKKAHLLSISVLAALCYLAQQQESRPCIKIILIGQAELVSKINALYLKKFMKPEVVRLPTVTKKIITRELMPAQPQKIIALSLMIAFGLIWWTIQKAGVSSHAPSLVQIHHSTKQKKTAA